MATEAAYSDERRSEVIALSCELGVTSTVAQTGVSRRTIYRWRKEADLGTVPPEKVLAALQSRRDTWLLRKSIEAVEAGADAEAVREQMVHFALEGQTLDAMRLVNVYGTLIDKAQLLTGGPTSRDERGFDWDGEMNRLRADLGVRQE